MDMNPKKVQGQLKISDDVLAQIAKAVVRDIDGVASSAEAVQPITISVKTEDQVAKMDVFVMMTTARKLQKTAEDIQRMVKSMVQDMTGIAVSKINVHIQDIVTK